ncbi:DUF418 domain-containing protein [Bacillus massiliigorillae]|uniref:DUF418 domain-containing protein n=1 Tax=Bacillus massiliigorillae TaxID=1243664 RepID=UPI0003A5DAA2|nr:DUF418 domain-containing protein [Bacillus massiliigorillae]
MKEKMQSIQESERIQSIDILRGFSILGIFFVNMPAFFSPVYYYNPATYWKSTSDKFLNGIVDFFAQASFYPLFAFLFGYGAIILAKRLRIKELSFPIYFSRRLVILLLFGCIHAFVLWHGDILITYAICGFFFLLFWKCKGKTLLLTGILIYVFVYGTMIFGIAAIEKFDDSASMLASLKNTQAIESSLQVYSNGSFTEIFSHRFNDWYLVNGPSNLWLLVSAILPLIMIGAGFAKQKWLENVKVHNKLLVSLSIFSFIGGVVCKLLPFFNGKLPYTRMLIQDYFGGPLLALFYITIIVLLVENRRIYTVLKPFSYVGRMSISNYLLQSLVCTTIFYSYGLGLYGQISFTMGFCLVILLYSLQMFASKWWLKTYKFGPVEYIWRWGTYGHKPSMKKRAEREN